MRLGGGSLVTLLMGVRNFGLNSVLETSARACARVRQRCHVDTYRLEQMSEKISPQYDARLAFMKFLILKPEGVLRVYLLPPSVGPIGRINVHMFRE